jgi:malate dehydrogenase (oxaloacetate-decarboxylating)
MVGAVDIVRMKDDRSIRDITVNAGDSEHGRRIVETVEALPETHVINISDRTFLMHLGGKIGVRSKMPVRTRDDLSMAHTRAWRGYVALSPRNPSVLSTYRSSGTPSP